MKSSIPVTLKTEPLSKFQNKMPVINAVKLVVKIQIRTPGSQPVDFSS
jgi:hypothetical protein